MLTFANPKKAFLQYFFSKNSLDKSDHGKIREKKARKNILISFLCRACTLALSFVQVPLILDCIGKKEYGLLLTITSVVTWFHFLDIGLGNGLRNRFAEAKAKENLELGRSYVSTTYAFISLISLVLFCSFLLIYNYVDWGAFFNAPQEANNTVSVLVFIVAFAFCIRLILNLIVKISQAAQFPSFAHIVALLDKVIIIVALLALFKTGTASILTVGLTITWAHILVLFISSLFLFSTFFKPYIPRFKFFCMKHAGTLMSMGVNFFIISVAVVALHATDNYLIAILIDPSEVPAFNIAKKLFQIPSMAFAIIMSPFWSAVTDAYFREDISWIVAQVKKLFFIFLLFLLCSFVLIVLSPYLYHFWLGDRLQIPISLSLMVSALTILIMFNSIFTNVINGMGKLAVQKRTAIITIFLNIPLSIFFVKVCGMGVHGVILGTLLSVTHGTIWRIIQYRKLVSGEAKGIWNR